MGGGQSIGGTWEAEGGEYQHSRGQGVDYPHVSDVVIRYVGLGLAYYVSRSSLWNSHFERTTSPLFVRFQLSKLSYSTPMESAQSTR